MRIAIPSIGRLELAPIRRPSRRSVEYGGEDALALDLARHAEEELERPRRGMRHVIGLAAAGRLALVHLEGGKERLMAAQVRRAGSIGDALETGQDGGNLARVGADQESGANQLLPCADLGRVERHSGRRRGGSRRRRDNAPGVRSAAAASHARARRNHHSPDNKASTRAVSHCFRFPAARPDATTAHGLSPETTLYHFGAITARRELWDAGPTRDWRGRRGLPIASSSVPSRARELAR